jgi:hypothetical protein
LSPDFIRRIRLPAYLIVAYLGVGSIVEVLVAAWPIHVHDLNWRLSALNAVAGASGTELLALFMLLVVAQASTSASGLWSGFSASLLAALGFLGAAAAFGLDSLQLRARVPANQLHSFDVSVIWTMARFGIVEVVCLSLAACALTAARSLNREIARDRSNRLIVGTSELESARLNSSGVGRGRTPRFSKSLGS